MPPIYFSTTNKEKLANAQHVCHLHGIDLESASLDIDEIQGENPVEIVKAKAIAAYEAFGKPIMVSDDSWSIDALRGFPGAYMKSINFWFTTDDFLRLMDGVTDRNVTLDQHLAYYDGIEIVTFNASISGRVLEASYDDNSKSAWMNVVTMEGDEGKSLAEVFNQPPELVAKRYENRPEVWAEAAVWYKAKYS